MKALALALAVVTPFAAAQDRVEQERLPVLLISGENNHDWNWTSESLRQMLEESGRFDVTLTEKPAETLADADRLDAYAAFVLDYNGSRWGEPAESNFIAAVREGRGVVVVHAADNAFPGWTEYEELVGLLWREGTGHGRFHLFDVEIDDADHPITRGMPTMVRHPDELYHRLVNVQGVDNRVLGRAFSDPETGGTGEREPMIIVREFGAGRMFHTPLGHVWKGVPQSRVSQLDPQFRRLLVRGTEWAATGDVTLSPIPPNWISPSAREAGFGLLFDGRSLEGWSVAGATAWAVDRASLHGRASDDGSWLVTDADHGDFDLRFEWALSEDGEAEVHLRFDPKSVDEDRVGATLTLRNREATGSNVFHTARVVVRDGVAESWIDGRRLEDPHGGLPLTDGARIALRPVHGLVWFRSLRARPLPANEEGAERAR